MFNDLREFIKGAKDIGQYKLIEGADWNLEIGAVTEIGKLSANSPLFEFDKITGYPAGYRVVSNVVNTSERFALATSLPLEIKGIEQVKAWREKVKQIKPLPPVEVKRGPVKENIKVGNDVNLFEFPVPKWHELDGGRYIGTGCMVINRDPDTGWINLGTYRVQVHDKSIATINYVPGRHGDIIRRKYWERGQPAPAAVVCGQNPLLWLVSTSPVARGISEYDWAGGLGGKPIEVVRGVATDLPIPSTAEIVLEGEEVPPGTETKLEGPFGEWFGYYASEVKEKPVFKVKAILHRNGPLLMGEPPSVGSFDFQWGRNIMRAGEIWNELDKQIPGVEGVWLPSRLFSMVIISLKQMYTGHAKQAAMIVGGFYGSAFSNRFIIIVDDDMDPSNTDDVLWALTSRCDPASCIDILSGFPSMRSDPMLESEKRRRDQIENSRAIIYACRPYHRMKDFPRSVKGNPELLAKVKEKFRL